MILVWNLDQKLNLTRETKQRQKIFDDNVISENCDAIAIFPICSQFERIWKPDSAGCIVYKTYIFINSNLLFYKNWKQN